MATMLQPLEGEILQSDLLTAGYIQTIFLNTSDLNPTETWTQLQLDPWFSIPLYTELEEKDDVIAASLDTRKDGVLALSRQVKPVSDKRHDKKIAEFVEETLEGYFDANAGQYTGLNAFLSELLDAVGKGLAVGEVLWGVADRVFVKNVKWKPAYWFDFRESEVVSDRASYLTAQTGPLRLRTDLAWSVGIGGEGLLPENKFVVGTYRGRYSNRWGLPLLRKCFWPSWFKRNGLRQWLRYLEKGSGTVYTRYADTASPEEKRLALDAARAMVEESATAFPKKFVVELMEHVRQSLGESHEGLVDEFANNALMRIILGQTLTSRGSEGGGSRALGEVHADVRWEKKEADAKFLMPVVNRYIVWPLVLFNFGPVKPPMWLINYDPQKDLTAIAEWLDKVTKMVPVPRSFVYTTFQIPAPTEGEDVVEVVEAAPESTNNNDDEDTTEFAEQEKKTPLKSRSGWQKPSGSRMERFGRLRPSTIAPSGK